MSLKDEIAVAAKEAAADMAEKLGMTQEEDMTNLREGQHVMLVTDTGIVVGQIRVVESEQKSAQYVTYLVDDTILSPAKFSEVALCKYRFGSNGEGGYFDDADIVCSLPIGATLYVRR